MPLQDHNFIQKKISLRDNFRLRLPKFIKDENDDVIYPQEIIKPLTKYFKDIYQYEAVFVDSWSAAKKALKIVVFVPGELTREDFIDDMDDFMEDYPSLKYQLNPRWPNAPQWNKEHEKEINEEKVKPKQIGYEMAQNIATSKKTRTSFSSLSNNELSIAKRLYELKYHKKPDLTSEEDQEELLFLYNNKVEEERGRLAIVKPSKEYLEKLEKEQGKRAAKEFEKKYTNEIYEGGTYDAVVNIFFQTSEFAPNKKGNVDLMNYYEIKELFRKVNINYLIETINDLIYSSTNHASKEEINEIKNELGELIRNLKEDLGWIKEWAFKNQLSEQNIKEYNETISKLEPLLKKIGVKIDFTLPKVGNILSEEDSAKKLKNKDSIKDDNSKELKYEFPDGTVEYGSIKELIDDIIYHDDSGYDDPMYRYAIKYSKNPSYKILEKIIKYSNEYNEGDQVISINKSVKDSKGNMTIIHDYVKDKEQIDLYDLAKDIIWHCVNESFTKDEIEEMINDKDKFIWNKLVFHEHTELFNDEDEMKEFCSRHSKELFEILKDVLEEEDYGFDED